MVRKWVALDGCDDDDDGDDNDDNDDDDDSDDDNDDDDDGDDNDIFWRFLALQKPMVTLPPLSTKLAGIYDHRSNLRIQLRVSCHCHLISMSNVKSQILNNVK